MHAACAAARRVLRRAIDHGPRGLLDWKEARYYRRHGEIELDLVHVLCRPDRDAIDVGAADGSYVLFMLGHARRVLAFEPLPAQHDRLRRRFAPDATLLDIALSDRIGTAILHVPMTCGGDAINGLSTLDPAIAAGHPRHLKLDVPVMPLDEIYDGELGFMKIDVEGHEQAVLDGARETLERCRPRLLIEADDTMVPGSRQKLVDRLSGLDYDAFFVRDSTLWPIAAFDPDIDQLARNWPGLGDGRLRRDAGYVSNFLFIPRAEVKALTPRLAAALARG